MRYDKGFIIITTSADGLVRLRYVYSSFESARKAARLISHGDNCTAAIIEIKSLHDVNLSFSIPDVIQVSPGEKAGMVFEAEDVAYVNEVLEHPTTRDCHNFGHARPSRKDCPICGPLLPTPLIKI